MTKKFFFLALVFLAFWGIETQAQSKMMLITTIESTVTGGLGRSRMVITHDDGKIEEQKMENLFSLTGINFGNINGNQSAIMTTLKKYTADGWKIVSVTPLTISPSEATNVGMFMTRYLLAKD